MKQWHSSLREKRIKTRQSKPTFDKKWRRFRPNCRFDVDQVPLPFVVDRKTTYEVVVSKAQKKDHKVWASQPRSGLDKRQCSLQVCFSPEDNVRVGIIFRATGKRISDEEKQSIFISKNVHVQIHK